MSARQHVLQQLLNIHSSEEKAGHERFPLTEKDQKLSNQIYFGVLKYHESLLEWLNHELLDKKLKPKLQRLQWMLLIGLYQIRYLDVPDHAAVSETVKLAKRPWEKKLINACLRQACRTQAPSAHSIEAQYNHPLWLIEALQSRYPEHWQNILTANMQKAPHTLRIHERSQWLQQKDLPELIVPACCDTAVILEKSVPIQTLPGYAEGQCFVQDIASQLVVPLLDLQPEQTVLDACSAPGGKACHISQHETRLKKLICLELAENRVPRLKENLTRAKASAEIVIADASQHPFEIQFDRILLDAPCSALGIIRRHPDIKLKRTLEDICKIQQTQQKILKHLWQHLEPGGKLLYTTCSILPDENEQQIENFLQNTADVQHIDIFKNFSAFPKTALQKKYGVQLIPSSGHIETSTDGFYYCLLQKELAHGREEQSLSRT